jgi:hypothetical protein
MMKLVPWRGFGPKEFWLADTVMTRSVAGAAARIAGKVVICEAAARGDAALLQDRERGCFQCEQERQTMRLFFARPWSGFQVRNLFSLSSINKPTHTTVLLTV